VVATIYQRPRTQGRMAFRKLHEFLAEGSSSHQVTLAPHLVTRGNLDFFLRAQSERAGVQRDVSAQRPAQEAAEDVA
jgi:hypothetical protein